jgi:D-glycero-D-manno-heptose 1,7-bisphosphate phosphatase
MAFFVFIDRDGTLIEEKNYLSDPDEVVMISGSAPAVRKLQAAGAKVVVISNQAGVGRGYFGVEAVHAIHQRIQEMLREEGCQIDAFYFCPHHPDDGCDCRKPRLGLFRRAAADFNLSLSGAMIGDNASDVQAGLAAGLTTILVRTGYGEKIQASAQPPPHHFAADLLEAAEWYLTQRPSSLVQR